MLGPVLRDADASRQPHAADRERFGRRNVCVLPCRVRSGRARTTDREFPTQMSSLMSTSRNRLPDQQSVAEATAQEEIKKIAGVREVMPIQVWTNNCRASLDIVVFNGASRNRIA